MLRRNTNQKLLVYNAIDMMGHVTTEDLISYLKQNDCDISLATIYRNLSILSLEGKIKKINLGNSLIYETIKEKHCHFICKSCGDIIDIRKEDLKGLVIPEDIMDNEVIDYDFVFFGYCKKCKKNNRKEDVENEKVCM